MLTANHLIREEFRARFYAIWQIDPLVIEGVDTEIDRACTTIRDHALMHGLSQMMQGAFSGNRALIAPECASLASSLLNQAVNALSVRIHSAIDEGGVSSLPDLLSKIRRIHLLNDEAQLIHLSTHLGDRLMIERLLWQGSSLTSEESAIISSYLEWASNSAEGIAAQRAIQQRSPQQDLSPPADRYATVKSRWIAKTEADSKSVCDNGYKKIASFNKLRHERLSRNYAYDLQDAEQLLREPDLSAEEIAYAQKLRKEAKAHLEQLQRVYLSKNSDWDWAGCSDPHILLEKTPFEKQLSAYSALWRPIPEESLPLLLEQMEQRDKTILQAMQSGHCPHIVEL